ncbi:MAG TPA: cofactor-independent phosphoglycerate mutase [bacterium]|nr:cofactor-independent phosphoglycerate mutase [bacterium]
MKLAVIVPDGLGDWPVKEIGNKTPLEAAHVPNLHELSKKYILGTLRTAPEGMYPGSDVCGLSLMGYDPKDCYTGRAPLEASNLGLVLKPGEMAFRCNLVNVEGDILTDYSGGHITTDEAAVLIREIQKKLGNQNLSFHPGKMYRHIMIVKKPVELEVTTDQPHDFQGNPYKKHWPKGKGAELLIELTEKSRDILENHPLNLKRASEGKAKANMIWLWGGGPAPKLERFEDKFGGVRGGVISAVDLLNGLGRYLGWEIISVPGATGYFDTDYKAKGEYGIKAVDRLDLVFIHIEATDEAGHSGLVHEKVKAIEQIDKHIVGPVVQRLKKEKEWRLYVAPDHYTPVAKKTHIGDPVPFIFAGSDVNKSSGLPYTEKAAKEAGVHIENGYELMHRLVRGW